jgi:hypothetical protein
MPETQMPLDPKLSRFGWTKAMRQEEFMKAREQAPTAHYRLVLQGQTLDLPIVRVHQNLPKYRLENGRTASAQVQFLAENPGKPKELFSGDPELWEAQEAQHDLLLKLAEKSDLRKYFEEATNKQVEPIILDENGFVINGNRRLATWRDLFHRDGGKFGRYEYIDVVVLPHVDDKAIDRLEASLQIEKDIKADYTWDAQANMMMAKRSEYSDKELAELYGKKDTEIAELLDMRSYADEWLKTRGKENMWSLVSGAELAFRRIVTKRKDIGGTGRQQLLKHFAFAMIDKPEEVKDSLHDAINVLANHMDAIVEKFKAEFPIEDAKPDAATEDLFGGGPQQGATEAVDLALSKEIGKVEHADKSRKIIVDYIDAQKQLKRDTKTAEKLLDCCAKANSMLEDGLKIGLGADTKTEGVEKQLEQIVLKVEKIREFLAKK